MTAQRVAKINQDVLISQGDYRELVFTTYDLDELPVNITGATITYEVRRHERAGVALITKQTGGSGIVIDADQVANKGQFTVTIEPSDTESLEGEYYHEASINLSNKPVKAMEGVFEVEQSVIQ